MPFGKFSENSKREEASRSLAIKRRGLELRIEALEKDVDDLLAEYDKSQTTEVFDRYAAKAKELDDCKAGLQLVIDTMTELTGGTLEPGVASVDVLVSGMLADIDVLTNPTKTRGAMTEKDREAIFHSLQAKLNAKKGTGAPTSLGALIAKDVQSSKAAKPVRNTDEVLAHMQARRKAKSPNAEPAAAASTPAKAPASIPIDDDDDAAVMEALRAVDDRLNS